MHYDVQYIAHIILYIILRYYSALNAHYINSYYYTKGDDITYALSFDLSFDLSSRPDELEAAQGIAAKYTNGQP